jgi:hypothetical protein
MNKQEASNPEGDASAVSIGTRVSFEIGASDIIPG